MKGIVCKYMHGCTKLLADNMLRHIFYHTTLQIIPTLLSVALITFWKDAEYFDSEFAGDAPQLDQSPTHEKKYTGVVCQVHV